MLRCLLSTCGDRLHTTNKHSIEAQPLQYSLNSMDKPFLDKRATEQLNLTVLRRVDPDTGQVLATAGHVALYDFDKSKKAWTRKDVEGSLFLLKRHTQPRFKVIILNKKSQDNFVEDVLEGFQFEVAMPYVLYRNKLDEVIGIWFYDEGECAMVAGLLQRITSAFPGQAQSEPQLPQVAASEAKMQLPAQTPTTHADPHQPQPQRGSDAFWNQTNSSATSATAVEDHARQLQPAMQGTSQVNQSSAMQDAAHGRGNLATPFANAAEQRHQQSGSSAGAAPVQANVLSMFQKLANGQHGAAEQDSHSSPPKTLSTPGPTGNSPGLQGPEPIGDAQQHNPLSALFANMKVTNSSTPVAATPQPHLRPHSGSLPPHSSTLPSMTPPTHLKNPSGGQLGPQQQPQGPAMTPPLLKTPLGSLSGQQQAGANSPALLTPSFFSQCSTPKESATSSGSQRHDGDDSLRQVLARAASKAPAQAEQPTTSLQLQAKSQTSAQDRVRQAMINLANSDIFIDLLVQELETKDLL